MGFFSCQRNRSCRSCADRESAERAHRAGHATHRARCLQAVVAADQSASRSVTRGGHGGEAAFGLLALVETRSIAASGRLATRTTTRLSDRLHVRKVRVDLGPLFVPFLALLSRASRIATNAQRFQQSDRLAQKRGRCLNSNSELQRPTKCDEEREGLYS